ncbi:MAG: hypothetical protein K1060chlam4_00228 [Candidatus Anoxychlamydiales bacterium]|nr:hypothetical protein [Candidatus Anoxychlamydiales bacterium]
MSKKQDEPSQLNGVDFFRLVTKESDPRTRIRVLALGHLQAGKKKMVVINMFQISLTSLRKWLLRFIKNGLECIQEGHRSGRKKNLV